MTIYVLRILLLRNQMNLERQMLYVIGLEIEERLNFFATWEEIYNPNFKVFESEYLKKQAGLLTFTPSV